MVIRTELYFYSLENSNMIKKNLKNIITGALTSRCSSSHKIIRAHLIDIGSVSTIHRIIAD